MYITTLLFVLYKENTTSIYFLLDFLRSLVATYGYTGQKKPKNVGTCSCTLDIIFLEAIK